MAAHLNNSAKQMALGDLESFELPDILALVKTVTDGQGPRS